MNKGRKKCAFSPVYISPNQLSLDCFKTPFEQQLNKNNRWVMLTKLIPRDEACNLYVKHVGISNTGRPPLNPRIVIGSLIIKHICNLDDRETVEQISEELIDKLYDSKLHEEKPRIYRLVARKRYLKTAQKRNKSRKETRIALGSQLRFLRRNLNSINRLLDSYSTIPIKSKDYKYLLVIQTVYQQANYS